jgi:hypothetical protein
MRSRRSVIMDTPGKISPSACSVTSPWSRTSARMCSLRSFVMFILLPCPFVLYYTDKSSN